MRMTYASRAQPRLNSASVDASATTRMDTQCLGCLGTFRLAPGWWLYRHSSALHRNYLSLTGDITEALRQSSRKPRHSWDAARLKTENFAEAHLKQAEANCLQVRTVAPRHGNHSSRSAT